jgi:RNase P subunit RPR2
LLSKLFGFSEKFSWEGDMSFQSVTKLPPTFFLGCEACPNCHEPVFAAEAADVTGHQVQYHWTCDLCGHRFTTEARLDEDVAA